jgi:hypothetical protein
MRDVILSAAVILAVSGRVLGVTTVGADLSAPGTWFNPGVRGTAVPSINSTRGGVTVGNPKSLEASVGSSIRGVFGGLEADVMDWRTRNFDQRPTTLDYLRYSRDFAADLVITANVRGLTRPIAGTTDGSREFYDRSIPTIARMAGEWVRYTNHIAQAYRQGDAVADPKDRAILDSLVWSTPGVWYDQKDLLPAPGEPPLPKVTYWEIGNEPRVPLKNSYRVQNSFTFYPPARRNQTDAATHEFDFTERYAAMAAAMRAEDATIKLGPCLQSATAVTEKEILQDVLKRQGDGQYLPVDFISYHPYQKMMDETTPAGVTAYLQGVYAGQKVYADRLRDLVAASGRGRESVELIASEVNVSNWPVNDTAKEAQVAHALGSVEAVFSFARLGVSAAHYWVFPAHQEQGTEYPVYKAYEGMRDHMGDSILGVKEDGATRVYTTRDSKSGEVAVWGLNFSNDADAAVQLVLSGLDPDGYTATLKTLRDVDGATTLFSGNYAFGMPGWPAQEVDWVVTDLAGIDLANYSMTLPAATISVLVLEPLTAVPEPGVAMIAAGAMALGLRRRQVR